MIKTSASQLKARLGKYMDAVRAGQEVVVTDRDRPVARLVPFRAVKESGRGLVVSEPRDPGAPPLGSVRVKAIRYSGPNTTKMLRDDRARR